MVIARPIEGKHRRIKTKLNWLLMALFASIPFIRINGHPLVLLDIPERKFHVFGMVIWPNELYFLHIILLTFGILLFFFTSLYGRLWCGYGCPQTIFTEFYDWVGRLAVGKKYGKKSMSKADWFRTYLIYFVLSAVFSFIFVGYFKGIYNMIELVAAGDIFGGPDSMVPAAWVLGWGFSTAVAFGNMAYFRENLCKLVCPYGRFQTALLDAESPIVSYDVDRGEPRRQRGQKEGEGDCTSCNMCNLVCPTGIDIREGLQIGCLACGLCVDACTIEMAKKDKPTLIDYRTIEQVDNPTAKRKYIRPRTIIYTVFVTVLVSVFVYLLSIRVPIYVNVVRDRNVNELYLEGMGVRNDYRVNIGNMSYDPLKVKVEILSDDKNLHFMNQAEDQTFTVKEGGYRKIQVPVLYEAASREKLPDSLLHFKFRVTEVGQPENSKTARSVYTFPR